MVRFEDEGNAIKQAVSLYPHEMAVVEKVRMSLGLGQRGFSAALRFIIVDWQRRGGDRGLGGTPEVDDVSIVPE